MQAVVLRATGGPEVLRLEPDYPLPQRQPGQVLVRVHSTSVNPIDTAVRAGRIPGLQLPKVLGGDVAGVVAEAPPNSAFAVGDKVAALTPCYWSTFQDGSYAQYAAVDEAHLAKLPEGALGVDTAGGVPLVALTAWQALMAAQPREGQRALILAASGGVGHMAVQLAKSLGLYVVGVAGPANAAWVKEALGADEVLDYSSQDWSTAFADNPFDLVVDCLPGSIAKCVAVLKSPGGHLSHIANAGTDNSALERLQQEHAAGKGPSASLTLVQPNGAQLASVLQLMAAGKVRLEVAQRLPLSEAAKGHVAVETGHTRGKVMLSVP